VKKIPTLFRRDPDDMKHVLPEVNPECKWVLDGEGVATRKYDGTCVMLDDAGDWWARREVKPGKATPPGFVPIGTDGATGKTVGWEPIGQSAFARWFEQALDGVRACFGATPPGTYELVGPKVNGNPEDAPFHLLVRHDAAQLLPDAPRDFEGLRAWLAGFEGEGIVWHHPDGRMAKLKRRDFA
jgi:hypothetical protein